MTRGHFVVLEGIDGAGTTTQAAELRRAFSARGLPAHVTAQPSGGPIGTIIRQVLSGRIVSRGAQPPGWATMSLLFAADRMDHQDAEIGPNLREGVNVVCDRYVYSSAIYQSASAGREDAVDWILEINRYARVPDLVLLLEVDVEIAIGRRQQRLGAREIYDDPEFQRSLAAGYRRLPEIFPDTNIVPVDGNRPIDEIAEACWAEVERLRARGAPV